MSVVGMITVDDLIAFCMDQWNIQLQQDLSSSIMTDDEKESLSTPQDPLERGIKTRLKYLIPYLQSNRWHEGMALGIRGPTNALQTQQQLQEMVEIIVASTTENDNGISSSSEPLGTPEKMALGAVYVATELHLLTDKSPGYQDTWNFLSHRMDDWRRICSILGTVGSSSGAAAFNNIGAPSLSGRAGDALFVVSSVASSLMGGLLSLVTTPGGGIFGLPQGVWESLFQNPQARWDQQQAAPPGTHPDDYKVPK